MNQVLKGSVYGKGTKRQIDFMAEAGGMNEEEATLFQLIHEGRTDLDIEMAMSLDRKARERIEESVRAKLTIAIFHCIDFTMQEEHT